MLTQLQLRNHRLHAYIVVLCWFKADKAVLVRKLLVQHLAHLVTNSGFYGNSNARSKFLDCALVRIRFLCPLCDSVHNLFDLVVALLDEVVLPLLQPVGLPFGLPPRTAVLSGVESPAIL